MSQQLLRFGLVGALNTALGYAVICLALYAGVGDFASNALGYGAGLLLSFTLNRSWTFAGRGGSLPRDAGAFALAWLLAYAANLSALAGARALGWVDNPLAHLFAIIVFTASFYLLSSRLVFGEHERSARSPLRLGRWLPEAALLALSLVAFVAIRSIDLTHDVIWQFWIARQMLGGAVLYDDIWELNPPLWFWSALPIQFLAEKLALSTGQLLVPLITLAGAVSALAMGHLGAFGSPLRRFLVMALAFWVCVPMPLFDFGQREQLTLICSLPYAMLIVRRHEGLKTPVALAALVGLLAAYGFAMKHYFVLVPVLLELWLLARQRRAWRPIRPETIMLALAALAYAAAVLLLAPEFLSRMVPMVAAAYHGYEAPVAKWFDEPAQLIWCFALLALLLDWRIRRSAIAPQTTAFALCALGFCAAYFLQRKGWQYHAIPVTGTLLLAVGSQITAQGATRIMRYPIALATIAFAIFVGIKQGSYRDYLRGGSEPVISTIPAGEPLAVLAADPMWAWPLVEEYRLKWPLQVYAYWMLPAIGDVTVRKLDRSPIAELEATVLKQTVDDLRCHPPAVVMIEKSVHSYDLQPKTFNVRAFFFNHEPFARFMNAHYREEAKTQLFHVFRRTGQVPADGSRDCRSIR